MTYNDLIDHLIKGTSELICGFSKHPKSFQVHVTIIQTDCLDKQWSSYDEQLWGRMFEFRENWQICRHNERYSQRKQGIQESLTSTVQKTATALSWFLEDNHLLPEAQTNLIQLLSPKLPRINVESEPDLNFSDETELWDLVQLD